MGPGIMLDGLSFTATSATDGPDLNVGQRGAENFFFPKEPRTMDSVSSRRKMYFVSTPSRFWAPDTATENTGDRRTRTRTWAALPACTC